MNDEVLIHCIPQCFSKDHFRSELDKVKPNSDFEVNILTTHIGVQGAGITEYEHAEAWINKFELELDFDYIALGDYHRPLQVSDKCAYAGVLCKGNFADRDSRHGIISYDKSVSEIKFLAYDVRGMEQYGIDCLELDVQEIDSKIEEVLSAFDRDKYIKIEFKNISKLKQRQLDFRNIALIKKEAFYCKVSYVYIKEVVSKEERAVQDNTIKPVGEELKGQLSKLIENSEDGDRLFELYEKNIKNEK